MKDEACLDSRNANAIKMLDSGDILSAKNIFLQNYRSRKLPMTMINLAVFLIDDHNILYKNAIYDSMLLRYRVQYGKTILNKCKSNFVLDEISKYHLSCLLGRTDVFQHHYDHAIKHYMEASKIKQNSIEALSMLSWLFILQHHYHDALSCLEALSQVLCLGTDFEKNLDVISESCPFSRFPYYQLLVYALSNTCPDKGKKLLNQMITMSYKYHELLFPAEELILLCLHLGSHSYLKSLIHYYVNNPWKNTNYINAILFSLECAQNEIPNSKKYTKIFAKYTTKTSQFAYYIKCFKTKNEFDYLLQHQLFPAYKECHFLNCPIHCETV